MTWPQSCRGSPGSRNWQCSTKAPGPAPLIVATIQQWFLWRHHWPGPQDSFDPTSTLGKAGTHTAPWASYSSEALPGNRQESPLPGQCQASLTSHSLGSIKILPLVRRNSSLSFFHILSLPYQDTHLNPLERLQIQANETPTEK